MEKRIKSIILGILYFIILFIIFSKFIGIIVSQIAKIFYNPSEGQIIYLIPIFITNIIAFILSILLAYMFIYFVTIQRLNDFLKPNKFKIITSLIIIIFVESLVYIKYSGIYPINYYLIKILTFNSIIFSGIFEFMEFVFPVIVYYLIVCLIYVVAFDKIGNVR